MLTPHVKCPDVLYKGYQSAKFLVCPPDIREQILREQIYFWLAQHEGTTDI